MKVCSNCGERNEDWMDICQRCGCSIMNANQDDTMSSNTSYENYGSYNSYDSYDNNYYNNDNAYNNDYKSTEDKSFLSKMLENFYLKIILAILLFILFVLIIHTLTVL